MSATTLGTQISHTSEGNGSSAVQEAVAPSVTAAQSSEQLVPGGLSAQLGTQEHQGTQAL